MDINKKQGKFRPKEWLANGNLNTRMDLVYMQCLSLELFKNRLNNLSEGMGSQNLWLVHPFSYLSGVLEWIGPHHGLWYSKGSLEHLAFSWVYVWRPSVKTDFRRNCSSQKWFFFPSPAAGSAWTAEQSVVVLLCPVTADSPFGCCRRGLCRSVLAELFTNSKAEGLCTGSMCHRNLSQGWVIFE